MAKTSKKPPTAAKPSSPALAAIEGALDDVKLPQQDKQKVVARLAQVVVTEQYSGPLPHPDHFQKYEDTLPGAAERVLRIAEKSIDHRIDMEKSMQRAATAETKAGFYCGAGLFLSLIVAAFASLFVVDNPVVPAIFLGAASVGGIAFFVDKRKP